MSQLPGDFSFSQTDPQGNIQAWLHLQPHSNESLGYITLAAFSSDLKFSFQAHSVPWICLKAGSKQICRDHCQATEKRATWLPVQSESQQLSQK